MFYLCSIGSNLDPGLHVCQAVEELLARFGHLRLSSVIRTKPVGMHSHHDFLNCLFVVQSELSPAQLKAEFVTMELAHGRDRNHPLCKVADRPLDIDILAWDERDDFAAVGVDAYLGELLAEMYLGGRIEAGKVVLSLPGSKVFARQHFGHSPVDLLLPEEHRGLGGTPPDRASHHATIRHH
ncbi:2-amino-4-hydroxy-6-hydroxymethyldihydropteridine diphosphokinase [Aeromonas sanarellii]|uniref:2-amino-4-hydroxy-6- hydroxymethyldihydropteridine diphosphokinase n=1 Tax=Aeromonas TaxID=642 RepID=UPI0025B63D18|nr:2-amino-4-hydroxy-6-hydroxymethyldihydropteridine diphosphokinase [Aeromonas caviae]